MFQSLEDFLHTGSEGVEHQHIDDQVHVVGMQEGMGKDPVVLIFVHDPGGTQVEAFKEALFAEGQQGESCCDDDDDGGDHWCRILKTSSFISSPSGMVCPSYPLDFMS